MAMALAPDGALDMAERPMTVELGHGPGRGATHVDWERSSGRRDNVRILQAYDQAGFERRVKEALEAV